MHAHRGGPPRAPEESGEGLELAVLEPPGKGGEERVPRGLRVLRLRGREGEELLAEEGVPEGVVQVGQEVGERVARARKDHSPARAPRKLRIVAPQAVDARGEPAQLATRVQLQNKPRVPLQPRRVPRGGPRHLLPADHLAPHWVVLHGGRLRGEGPRGAHGAVLVPGLLLQEEASRGAPSLLDVHEYAEGACGEREARHFARRRAVGRSPRRGRSHARHETHSCEHGQTGPAEHASLVSCHDGKGHGPCHKERASCAADFP
mmetsp:Transcript_15348/g.51804  ORF Transcript_15348/g.51804 Transcript_15348/m.51804 type:complete len:262 (-) Transcript_15348:35-820(-)